MSALDGGAQGGGGARSDLAAAGIWLASRVSVFIAAFYASWVVTGQVGAFFGGPGELEPDRSPVGIWDRWDVEWYRSIAEDGYVSAGHENSIAFLPGLPMLMRAFHAVGVDVSVTGLLVSLVAGLAAAVALARLTRAEGGIGELGVLAWVCAPMAVFLAAPYTESLFAAFAFWAWYLARRGAWVWAGVLATVASLVRVNGLFLTAALVVLLLTRSRQSWRRGLALLLPFAAVAGFVAYLHTITGSWSSWLDAQQSGWGREFGSPFDAMVTTYEMAFSNGVAASFAVQYRFELAAVALLVAFTIVLAATRRWAEATYVLLTLVALATSTLFYSAPRSLLTLFPIWVLLGIWMSRRRWILVGYLAVSTPLMFVGVVAFTTGRWVA